METTRPHLTQNVHHLGLKLAALAGAIATSLFAGGTTASYAVIASLVIGVGFAAELVQSARGEEISPAVRWRYLIVAACALALLAVHRHPAFHYKVWAELGLVALVAVCSWELVARIRGRLAPATAKPMRWISVWAPTLAETSKQLVAYLERNGGRLMVVAARNEQGHVGARFLIGAPAHRATAVREYVKQTLGADKAMNMRDVRELLPHEHLLVDRWADLEGVARDQVDLKVERELPELADVAAYQLRFRAQQGAGLLALKEGEPVFDTYSPELLEAAAKPEVGAAMVIVDLAEVPASTKRGLTAQMTQMLDDGETLRLRFNGLGGGALARLIRYALIIGVPVFAARGLHTAWPLIIPALFGLAFFWSHVLQVGGFLLTGRWKPRAQTPGIFSFVREQQPERELTDEEKETQAFMRKKRDGRLFTGAAYVVVIPAAPLGDAELDVAHTGAVVDEMAKWLAQAVVEATADSRTGGTLEASKLEDPRRAFTGDLPRHGDTRFLLKPSEAAALLRPLDLNANSMFQLDHTGVPNLPVPKLMPAAGPGMIDLGEAGPGSVDERPVATTVQNTNGTWLFFGNSRMGKTNALADRVAEAILAGYPVVAIDPANMCKEILMRLADKEPQILESGEVIYVDWANREQVPYWNPMVARNDDEVDLAVKHTMNFIQSIVGDISSQAPRAIGYLEAVVPPVVKFNRDIYETSVASGRDPDEAFYASMLAIYTILEQDNADLLWSIVARYGNHTQQQRWRRYFEMVEQNAKQAASEYLVIQQRLERVFNNDQLARIMGSPKNRLNFEDVILGKVKMLHEVPVIGGQEDVAGSILGLLFLIYCDVAWSVYKQLEAQHEKPPFHVCAVDEAHNAARVAPREMVRMFRELAKSGICPWLATQHPLQFKDAGGADVYNEMWQAMNLSVFQTTKGADDLANKLDPTGKRVSRETVQTIQAYNALEKHNIHTAGGRVEQGPFVVKAPAPPSWVDEPDRKAWFAGLVDKVRAFGAARICRPLELAAWEVDHQTIREQLIAELERIHGPQAMSLPLGELPARPVRPSSPATTAAPTTNVPATPSAHGDDEEETVEEIAEEAPAMDEAPDELPAAELPAPDLQLAQPTAEADEASHVEPEPVDDALGWDDLDDVA